MTPPKSHNTARSIRPPYRWAATAAVVVAVGCSGSGDTIVAEPGERGVGAGQQASPASPLPSRTSVQPSAAPQPGLGEPSDIDPVAGEPSGSDAGLGEPSGAAPVAGTDWQKVTGNGYTLLIPPGWQMLGVIATGTSDGQTISAAVVPAGPIGASIVADGLLVALGGPGIQVEQSVFRGTEVTALRLRVTYGSGLIGLTYVVDTSADTYTVTVAPVDGGPDVGLIDAIVGSLRPA